MEQKNTIVKCKAHPNCLFNHNGICDNYVINIGADGSCQEYVETESNEEFIELEGLNYQKVKFNRQLFQLCAKCTHSLTPAEYEFSPACLFSEDASIRLTGNCPYASQRLRGQRAKCDFYEDGWADPEIVKEACQSFTSDMMDIDDKHLGEAVTVKIPDPKDMDIRFTIQNTQWNKEFLRDQMCWYCDNGFYGSCKLTAKPSLDRSGKCPRYTSTGGNR